MAPNPRKPVLNSLSIPQNSSREPFLNSVCFPLICYMNFKSTTYFGYTVTKYNKEGH